MLERRRLYHRLKRIGISSEVMVHCLADKPIGYVRQFVRYMELICIKKTPCGAPTPTESIRKTSSIL